VSGRERAADRNFPVALTKNLTKMVILMYAVINIENWRQKNGKTVRIYGY
jgi:hypothetical protein